MMITTITEYSDSLDLTFNASEVEVVGYARLKTLGLQGSEVFVATGKIQEDADRFTTTGGMTPVGAGVGMIEVGGKRYYDLTDTGTGKYYSADASNIASITNTYTIRMKFTPTYTGNPAFNNFILTTNASGNNTSLVELKHTAVGILTLSIYTAAASGLVQLTSAWSPVANQEYEFEIVNNGTNLWLFVDGVSFFTTAHTCVAGVRDSIRIGTNSVANERSTFRMRDFQIFSTAVHTANFASEVPRIVNVYSNSASVENVASVTTEELYSFSPQTFGSVKYAISISDVDYYISGGVLTPSNLSYAQANDIADIQSNIALINNSLGSGAFVKLIPILSSGANGDEQSQIDSIAYEYDFYSIANPPSICTVYGFLYDNLTPILTASVRFFTKKPFKIGNVLTVLDETVAVDSSGYYEIDLAIPDASYPINFELSFADADDKIWKDSGSIVVPNQQSAELNTIRI